MTRLKREEEKRSNGATCVARAREGWKRKATKLEGRTVLDQPRDIARLPLYNVARYISGYAHVFVHPRKILYIPLTWKTWIGLASNQATNCHSWQFIIFKIMKNWKSDDFCTIFQLRTAAKLEEIRRFFFPFFFKSFFNIRIPSRVVRGNNTSPDVYGNLCHFFFFFSLSPRSQKEYLSVLQVATPDTCREAMDE